MTGPEDDDFDTPDPYDYAEDESWAHQESYREDDE